MKGQLWVVAAPSGGGKTSLIAKLRSLLPKVVESVSHTTRERRNGEIEGQHYYFVTRETFAALREADGFLEFAEVFHHCYGTSKAEVERWLAQGFDVILSIDWQGAAQVRARCPEVRTVFLLPPSVEALRERLLRRGQDNLEVVERRMAEAKEQIGHYRDFDYVIVNDDFERAAAELRAIVVASRLERARAKAELDALASGLLEE